VHFALVISEMGVSQTIICLAWTWTTIILISASQVARIISMRHLYLTPLLLSYLKLHPTYSCHFRSLLACSTFSFP
jgi:hypothetical protein